jgi:hypothetical protein
VKNINYLKEKEKIKQAKKALKEIQDFDELDISVLSSTEAFIEINTTKRK